MQIIPIASGKGGVGKSLLSANLAVTLGKLGKRVVLVDLDLGASNLHLAIGQNVKGASIGTYLMEKSAFADIIEPTDYKNLSFIAGDSQIPGLTALKATQKQRLVKNLHSINADFVILDLGAGTHQIILDMFLQSPQGILVTSPTVTATLDGYLFIKNCVFRLMYTTFKKGSPGRALLDDLKKSSDKMKSLYIPRIIEGLKAVDKQNTLLFQSRLAAFSPRLVINMIDDPKDIDKATRIRNSCSQYLGVDLEYLGVMYRDALQDKALASRLPVTVYKPHSVLSTAITRIAEKVIATKPRRFDSALNDSMDANASFMQAEDEVQSDYALKLSGIDDLVGSGQLTTGELIEMIKTQSYELTQIKKENLLLKSKLVKAAKQGFKVQ